MFTLGNAPLFEGLMKFAEQQPASFHVPGHRNGQVYRKFLTEVEPLNQYPLPLLEALTKLAQIDVTELSTTDDLHEPEGIIKQAQQKAARYFGADDTFFLVGGSTSGNVAIILSTCNPGDLILVQRNVHKSIINGCKLAGVQVVFLTPEQEQTTALTTIPSIKTIKAALLQYKEVKAVILTNPNYYGLSVKLEKYVELIHSYNIPVIVDAAHGAHYGLHSQLPQSALQAGADAVIQSTHKTLPALTMAAMLHIRGNRIDLGRLQQTLAMIESSSPSYLLMASLDVARAMMEEKGNDWINEALQHVERLSSWLRDANLCIQLHHVDISDERIEQDPFRLLIYDRSARMDGFELQRELEKYNVWVEMATVQYAVLVVHLSLTENDVNILKEAILHVASTIEEKLSKPRHETSTNRIHYINEGAQYSLPIQMQRYERPQLKRRISLDAAVGAISAEMVVPYPPGIPILFEGEVITSSIRTQIKELIEYGAKFQGSSTIAAGEIQVFMND